MQKQPQRKRRLILLIRKFVVCMFIFDEVQMFLQARSVIKYLVLMADTIPWSWQ